MKKVWIGVLIFSVVWVTFNWIYSWNATCYVKPFNWYDYACVIGFKKRTWGDE